MEYAVSTDGGNYPIEGFIQGDTGFNEVNNKINYRSLKIQPYVSLEETPEETPEVIIKPWVPDTPERIHAYNLFGPNDNPNKDPFYRVISELQVKVTKEMQGPKCIEVMEYFTPADMELVRTYNILPEGASLENPIYSTEEFAEVVIDIPVALRDNTAEYKMICIGENASHQICDDLDNNPDTFTLRTNKFYAYGLYISR